MLFNSSRRLKSSRVQFALSFSILCLVLFPAQTWADSIEDVLKRMTPEGFQIFAGPAQQLKDAGSRTFYKVGGYQARILRSFCSEVYGTHFNGEVPAVMVSGGSGVRRGKATKAAPIKRSKLEERIAATVKNCKSIKRDEKTGEEYVVDNRELVAGFLREYWTVTADRLEAYMTRLAKFVNIHRGQEEHLIYGHSQTTHIEAALEAHAGSSAFSEAVRLDTNALENQVFADLDKIFIQVRTQLRVMKKYDEVFPTEESLAEAMASFSQEIADAEAFAKAHFFPAEPKSDPTE